MTLAILLLLGIIVTVTYQGMRFGWRGALLLLGTYAVCFMVATYKGRKQ